MLRTLRRVGLVLLLVALVATAFTAGVYAADAEVRATLVDKRCAGPEPPAAEPDAPNGTAQPDAAKPARPGGPPTPPAPEGGANSTVTLRAALLPIEATVENVDDDQCRALRPGDDGNFIVYHLRTGRALIYEREGGVCLFDTLFGVGCVLPEAAEAAAAAAAFAEADVVLSTSGYVRDPLDAGLNRAPNCVRFPADHATRVAAVADWHAGDPTQERLRLFLWAEDAHGHELAHALTEGPAGLETALDLPDGAATWVVGVEPPADAAAPLGTVPSVAVRLGARGAHELTPPEPAPCRGPSAGAAATPPFP